MKKWLAVAGIAVAAFVIKVIAIGGGAAAGSAAVHAYNDSKQHEVIQAKLVEVMNQINKSVPVMVDKVTRLDSANGLAWQLTYSYTFVGTKASEVNTAALNRAMRPYLFNAVCKGDVMKVFVDNDIPVTYIYHDDYGVEIARYRYTQTDCRRGNNASKPAA
ncbi:hypothetical protein [Burkholderia sp. Bp9143]|uniref:hypothetical protein n=1 Tax=Burkholderia sp. Bp9143 TaxID=2184574 RepID=UPI000F5B072F|nr:hypothetical protein [Burkholderia sp. Bp9143]